MAGDYISIQRQHQGFRVDFSLDGGAVATTLAKAVRSANHQIFVQRIVMSYTTHVAGKVITIQDDAGTPVAIANRADLAAAAGVPDVVTWDFGPLGSSITLGKNLQYVANTGGSGFTGILHIEGYQKLRSVINTGTANTDN